MMVKKAKSNKEKAKNKIYCETTDWRKMTVLGKIGGNGRIAEEAENAIFYHLL